MRTILIIKENGRQDLVSFFIFSNVEKISYYSSSIKYIFEEKDWENWQVLG